MKHSKPVRLETAPTGGKSVYLFLEFSIIIPHKRVEMFKILPIKRLSLFIEFY